MALLITYDLHGRSADYRGLIDEIKSLGPWWHHLESTWIVDTSAAPDELWSRLKDHLGEGDHLLILEVRLARRQGWLPKRAWKWLRTHLPKP